MVCNKTFSSASSKDKTYFELHLKFLLIKAIEQNTKRKKPPFFIMLFILRLSARQLPTFLGGEKRGFHIAIKFNNKDFK